MISSLTQRTANLTAAELTPQGHRFKYTIAPTRVLSHRLSEENMLTLRNACLGLLAAISLCGDAPVFCAEPLPLKLRYQVETSEGSGRYHRLTRDEAWAPEQTAIIVCDMWDSHHCYRAVQREKEFAPRLNQMLIELRKQGVTIIHAPSGCMKAYEDHPARHRALQVPPASDFPKDIATWCYQIPAEERAKYPIDQTDGGEDDTSQEHAQWEEELRSQGRNPKAPWLKQIDVLGIDAERDYISDSGTEIWSLLKQRDIRNVMLSGVHTNMCVLGRPFGLRRLATAGINVALVRDLTDTMYNPAREPFVSHFSGTDLIIDHIERLVCPTITSDQLLSDPEWGDKPFRFSKDDRRHIGVLISESEYGTQQTLPKFLEERIRRDHRLSYVFGDENDPNQLPGIEQLNEVDVLIVSVRRRTPPLDSLKVIRKLIASGKPVIGIRTASHAFCNRDGSVPEGAAAWPEFDAQVFGGHYTNHYGTEHLPTITVNGDEMTHALLRAVSTTPFKSESTLYQVRPISDDAVVLMEGKIEGQPAEPVAWHFKRQDGGISVYTSLGGPSDFESPQFRQLLENAIHELR